MGMKQVIEEFVAEKSRDFTGMRLNDTKLTSILTEFTTRYDNLMQGQQVSDVMNKLIEQAREFGWTPDTPLMQWYRDQLELKKKLSDVQQVFPSATPVVLYTDCAIELMDVAGILFEREMGEEAQRLLKVARRFNNGS